MEKAKKGKTLRTVGTPGGGGRGKGPTIEEGLSARVKKTGGGGGCPRKQGPRSEAEKKKTATVATLGRKSGIVRKKVRNRDAGKGTREN